jgi:hypothetical protein
MVARSPRLVFPIISLVSAFGCSSMKDPAETRDDTRTKIPTVAPIYDGGDRGAQPRACHVVDQETKDLYVDVNANDEGTGTIDCPARTITQAVRIARSLDGERRTIHVAAGDYSYATGERFPIEVRGVRLQGAKGGGVQVFGNGPLPSPLASEITGERATFLIGDAEAQTEIENVRVLPIGNGQTAAAIVCDRGTPNGPPNTAIDAFSFEAPAGIAESDTAVFVSGEGQSKSCNLRITRSVMNRPVIVRGCRQDPLAPQASPRLVLGDITEDSNVLRGASGLVVGDCHGRINVIGNRFTQSLTAVAVSSARFNGRVALFRNSFDHIQNIAVELRDGADVELYANTFFRNPGSVALVLLGGQLYPSVYARQNEFQSGVVLGEGALASDRGINFGQKNEPGANSFYAGDGHALTVRVQGASLLPFAGNYWSHVPPKVRVDTPSISTENLPPTDILVAEDAPNLDIMAARELFETCAERPAE